jgi:signal transduction histidine kinase/CheY-like chemotaxis protein
MHRLLARQLKKHLGIKYPEVFFESIQNPKEISGASSLDQENVLAEVSEKFPQFLKAVLETYHQFERDLDLRTRSLELSSAELFQANEALRNQANVRERAIDQLWTTALDLSSEADGLIYKSSEENIESLALLMHGLVQQRLKVEAQLKSVSEHMPGVMFRAQPPFPRVFEFLSLEVERLLGCERESLMGVDVGNSLDYRIESAYCDSFANLLSSLKDGEKYEVEYQLRHQEGRLIWVVERGIAHFKDGGIWLDGLIFDLSQQKQLESELRRAREIADETSRMKSAFLANMSHEIRTPMNAILGLSELGCQVTELRELPSYLEKIHTSADLLLSILNDILDFSKIEAGGVELEAEPFWLEDLLRKLITMHEVKAKSKGLYLDFELDNNLPPCIEGDAVRFGQVLSNLIGNGIKFTPQGGVRVRVVSKGIPEKQGNDSLLFEIQDTGIGLNPQQLEKLFKPFAQADVSTTRQFGGTGLGLTISKSLIEAMGGEIWVESVPCQGSCFYVQLQVKVIESNLKPKNTGTHFEIPRFEGFKILLVEDNRMNQQVATAILRKTGVDVWLANDGQEAIDLLMSPIGQQMDLVLMDMQMPLMDGRTATRILRADARFNDLPILALTAHAFIEEKNQCRLDGMDDFLTKPIRSQDLYDALRRWIHGRYGLDAGAGI